MTTYDLDHGHICYRRPRKPTTHQAARAVQTARAAQAAAHAKNAARPDTVTRCGPDRPAATQTTTHGDRP